MIIKIDIHKIKHQNIRIFTWDYGILKKNKLKQIINTNLKSTKSLKDKIDFKKKPKGFNWKMEF